MSQSESVPAVKQIEIEGHVFSPLVNAPGSTKSFFLGGAGVRGLEIQGRFVKFTVIGVYLEDSAVETLAVKWKGKTVEELSGSLEFYRDIVTGPFEKFMRVTMILPLTGSQYSEKVTENCVAFWKSVGTYTDAEAKAVETFINVFKDQTFPPGASILFTQSPLGALTISFSKDGSIPEVGTATIENKQLSEAILESMIGKHGVSPDTKKSLAERLSEFFKVEKKEETVENGESKIVTPCETKEITKEETVENGDSKIVSSGEIKEITA